MWTHTVSSVASTFSGSVGPVWPSLSFTLQDPEIHRAGDERAQPCPGFERLLAPGLYGRDDLALDLVDQRLEEFGDVIEIVTAQHYS